MTDLASDEDPTDDREVPVPTLAVVLAAGAGTRFVGETHKLAVQVSKRPLLWWATKHALDAGFEEVVVIQGAISVLELVPAAASIVHNDDWEQGQAGSLQVAVHYADSMGYQAMVVGLGDQPLVPPEAWRRVGASANPIAVASFGGSRTPPVRLHSDVWGLLPLDGDEGARQILRSRPELVTEIPCPGSAIDVDTFAEYDKIRRNQLAKELGSWI